MNPGRLGFGIAVCVCACMCMCVYVCGGGGGGICYEPRKTWVWHSPGVVHSSGVVGWWGGSQII